VAEEQNVVMLNGGEDFSVGLVAGADVSLTQVLKGEPRKTGLAILKVVKNTSGVPFVAVFIGGTHAGTPMPKALSRSSAIWSNRVLSPEPRPPSSHLLKAEPHRS
jgi:hypothetical protein